MNSLIYTDYEELYGDMQAKLEQYCGSGRNVAEDLEARLGIAWRYRNWLPLGNIVSSPVTYWRWHWPRFESEVKYQELCYTFELCPPTGSAAEERFAVLEERLRRSRHIRTNLELFRYLRGHRVDRDDELFIVDPVTSLKNSEWIAALWAFDRYELFIEEHFPRSGKARRPLRSIWAGFRDPKILIMLPFGPGVQIVMP